MAGTQQVTSHPAGDARPRDEADASEGKHRNPTRTIVLAIVGVVVVIAALFFGIPYFAYASAHQTTDDATIDADEVQVTSKIGERVRRILVDTDAPVHRGQLLIELDNRDERTRVAQAQAAVDAQIAQARAAQETVALTRDTQAAQNAENSGAVDQARANIASASEQSRSIGGQIAVLASGVSAAKAQLRAAQDAVPAAAESLRRARADLARAQSLVRTGDVAAQDVDAARAAYATAQSSYAQTQSQVAAAVANVASAQQRLDAQRYATTSAQALVGVQQGALANAEGKLQESGAPSRVPAQQAQADAARAQIESLRAQLATAANELSYTRIVSPIDGYVGQKNVEIGQTVAAGTPLLTLIPANHIYVTANYKETQVGRMRVGQTCDIGVDAYKGVTFIGHVADLSPAAQNKFSLIPAQNATGNFVKVTQRLPVRIFFDRVKDGNLSDYALRPGMSVEASCQIKG